MIGLQTKRLRDARTRRNAVRTRWEHGASRARTWRPNMVADHGDARFQRTPAPPSGAVSRATQRAHDPCRAPISAATKPWSSVRSIPAPTVPPFRRDAWLQRDRGTPSGSGEATLDNARTGSRSRSCRCRRSASRGLLLGSRCARLLGRPDVVADRKPQKPTPLTTASPRGVGTNT